MVDTDRIGLANAITQRLNRPDEAAFILFLALSSSSWCYCGTLLLLRASYTLPEAHYVDVPITNPHSGSAFYVQQSLTLLSYDDIGLDKDRNDVVP